MQGNINAPHHSVFKICGVRQRRLSRANSSSIKSEGGRGRRKSAAAATTTAASAAAAAAKSASFSSAASHFNSSSNSDTENSSGLVPLGAISSRDSLDSGLNETSPGGSRQQLQQLKKLSESDNSCASSLDSEAVGAFMAKLALGGAVEEEELSVDEAVGGDDDFEDEEEEDDVDMEEEDDCEEGTDVFKVVVVDCDTGLDYKMGKVKVVREKALQILGHFFIY